MALGRCLAIAFVLAAAAANPGCLGKENQYWLDLITSKDYTKLVVELDYAEGHQPRADATNLLKQRMNERLDKPGGITIVETAFTPTDTSYSDDDLQELESDHRNRQPGGDTMVLYVLYLNGHHERDNGEGKVLGVNYGSSASIAIFKETIDSQGGLLGFGFNAADVERAVLVHEFGHAIGLVDLRIPMVNDHEDPDHRFHSRNENSVMYWAVENTLGLPLLDRIPNEFDEDDIRDVRAAGGK